MSHTAGLAGLGTCSACGLVFHLVASTGVLHRHGFSGIVPPFVGSGQLPAAVSRVAVDQADTSVLDEGLCCSLSSRTGLEISSDEHIAPFMITTPPFSIIKRILRAARYKASVVFTSCLRDVIHNGSTANWEHLLNFPRALSIYLSELTSVLLL